MTFDEVRELALRLPEAVESTAYGTPCFRVRKRLFARLREDGSTFVVPVDPLEREALLADPSGAYFITPHYQDHAYVLVRIEDADPDELWELLVEAWLERAPKRLAAEHQAELLGDAD